MGPKKRKEEDDDEAMGRDERKAMQNRGILLPVETHKNRLAQKKFRERKENRIKELEDRVAVLSSLLAEGGNSKALSSLPPSPLLASASASGSASGSGTGVCPCSDSDLAAKMDTLEKRVATLAAENAALKNRHQMVPVQPTQVNPIRQHHPTSIDHTSTGLLAQNHNQYSYGLSQYASHHQMQSLQQNSSHLFQMELHNPPRMLSTPQGKLSAAVKFGLPNIESARTALKSLPSLSNSIWVDQLFEALQRQAVTTDSNEIKRQLLKFIRAKYAIFEDANMLDRVKAIEVIELTKKLNHQHIDHMNAEALQPSVFQTPTDADMLIQTPAEKLGTPHLASFKNVLHFIPSLSGRDDLIDAFCQLFISSSHCRDRIQRAHGFFQIVSMKNRLFHLCDNDDDRNRFALSLEMARQENRAAVNNLFNDVELALQKLI
ncbi:hypothetical protein BJ741DRAFT_166824 [Chytriomyces cf. hyalinus JEL632]|nr:hypothetical protein BJ741DRAFT_166824 [Chytriomyces cf. hyalinus JEL632]